MCCNGWLVVGLSICRREVPVCRILARGRWPISPLAMFIAVRLTSDGLPLAEPETGFSRCTDGPAAAVYSLRLIVS